MSAFSGIAQLIGFVALAAAVFLFYLNRQQSARVQALQEELAEAQRKQVPAPAPVKPAPAPVAPSKPAPAPVVAAPKPVVHKEVERPAKPQKKKDDPSHQQQLRIRELEQGLVEVRRQLEQAQKLVKQRDEDVRGLKEELEETLVALAEKKAAEPVAPPPPVNATEEEQEQEMDLAAELAAQTVSFNPEQVSELEARVKALQTEAFDADAARREAVGRANLAELELHRLKERLVRLDKRAHELMDRLVASEKVSRSAARKYEDLDRMYEMLKGRYGVAIDVLLTFREKFGVAIPTEVGVAVHSPIEAHLELEDEEVRPNRPRGDRLPPRGEHGRPAEAAPQSIAIGEPNGQSEPVEEAASDVAAQASAEAPAADGGHDPEAEITVETAIDAAKTDGAADSEKTPADVTVES